MLCDVIAGKKLNSYIKLKAKFLNDFREQNIKKF